MNRIFEIFIKPPAVIPKNDRETAILHNALALFLIVFLVIGAISGLYLTDIKNDPFVLVMLTTSVLVLFSYFIGRSKYYKIALFATVIILCAQPYLMIVLREVDTPEKITLGFIWLLVGIILGSMILSYKETIVLVIINLLFVAAYPLFFSDIQFKFIIGSLGIVGTISGLIILNGYLFSVNRKELANKTKLLSENERKYRMLFTKANDAIFIIQGEKLIDCNPNSLDLFGYTNKQDFFDRLFWSLSPISQPDGQNSAEKAKDIQFIALKGMPRQFYWQFLKKNGIRVDAEVSLTTFNIGKELFFLGIARDITERMKNERLKEVAFQIAAEASRENKDIRTLSALIHQEIGSLVDASNFYIAIYDEKTDILNFPYFVDEISEKEDRFFTRKFENGLTEHLIRTGKPILMNKKDLNKEIIEHDLQIFGTIPDYWMGVPLKTKHQTIGALVIQSYDSSNAYSPSDLEFLIFLSSQIAQTFSHEQYELALQKNEKRYRDLVEMMFEGIIKTDENDNILFVNKSFCQIFNYTKGELIGKNIEDVFIMEENLDFFQDISTKRKKGISNRYEIKMIKKSGDSIWVSVSASPIINTEGIYKGVHAIISDIDNRKKAEEQLRKSENKFRELVQTTNVIPWESDVESGLFTYVGEQAVSMLGYPLENWKEKNFWIEKTHPDDREFVKDYCLEALKTRKEYNFEYRMVSASGEILWLHDVVNVFKDKDTGGLKLRGFMINITDRKQSEENLKASEEKYKGLFDNESDAIVVFDAKTKVFEEVNNSALAFFGYSKEEFMQMKVADIYYEKDKTEEGLKQLLKGVSGSQQIPLKYYIRKDKTIFPGETSLGTFISKGRKKVIGAIRDISKRLEAEANVLNASIEGQEIERQRIASDLHDSVGQYLSAIKMNLNAMREDSDITTDERKELENIAIDILTTAITEVRTISYNLISHSLQELGLIVALQQMIDRLQIINDTKIHFTNNIESERLDQKIEIGLYRILQETLNNTMKHAEAKNAYIEILRKDREIMVVYKDDGMGMEIEDSTENLSGMGMQSIGNRLKVINGIYHIESAIGSGFRINIYIPYPLNRSSY